MSLRGDGTGPTGRSPDCRARPSRRCSPMPLDASTVAPTAAGVEVVVVAFGAPELLDACLRRSGRAVPRGRGGQLLGSAVRPVAEAPRGRLRRSGRNLGFAAGVNLGCARRRGRTRRPAAQSRRHHHARRRTSRLHRCLHGRAGPGLRGPGPDRPGTGRQRPGGLAVPDPGRGMAGGGRPRPAPPEATDFLIGSVLLLRAPALAEVGGFDEQFFLYAEETDWQRRAADRGWRVALCPEVTATHVGAGTGGDPIGAGDPLPRLPRALHPQAPRTVGWWSTGPGPWPGPASAPSSCPGDAAARRPSGSTSTGRARAAVESRQ